MVLGRAQELGSLGVLGLLAPELRNPAPDAPAKEKRVRRSAKIARACVPGEDEGGIGKYPSSAICHCLPRRTQGAQSRRREVLKGSPRARLAEHGKCASGQHALRPLRLKRSESAPSPRWSCTRSLELFGSSFCPVAPRDKITPEKIVGKISSFPRNFRFSSGNTLRGPREEQWGCPWDRASIGKRRRSRASRVARLTGGGGKRERERDK